MNLKDITSEAFTSAIEKTLNERKQSIIDEVRESLIEGTEEPVEPKKEKEIGGITKENTNKIKAIADKLGVKYTYEEEEAVFTLAESNPEELIKEFIEALKKEGLDFFVEDEDETNDNEGESDNETDKNESEVLYDAISDEIINENKISDLLVQNQDVIDLMSDLGIDADTSGQIIIDASDIGIQKSLKKNKISSKDAKLIVNLFVEEFSIDEAGLLKKIRPSQKLAAHKLYIKNKAKIKIKAKIARQKPAFKKFLAKKKKKAKAGLTSTGKRIVRRK